MTDHRVDLSAVAVGDELPRVVVTDIRADDIMMMALVLRDSNPIHFSVDAVKSSRLGERVVNQGSSSMAYLINVVVHWTGSRSSLRRIQCRFSKNVFAGDDVAARGTVVAIRSTPDGRLVDLELSLTLPDGAVAVSGTATVLA